MTLARQRWYPQLEGSGTNFLTVQAIRKAYELLYQLEDSTARLLEGLHSERETSYPPGDQQIGAWFYETDRDILYVVATIGLVQQWKYVAGVMRQAVASRPGDLQASDENFFFEATDQAILYRWSGTAWTYEYGTMVELIANRPTPSASENGFLFEATDQTVIYQWSGTAWTYESGTMRGTLNPDLRPTLVAAEVGFLFFSTDFEHVFRWGGAAWTFAPGDPGSKFIVPGVAAAPLGGVWVACTGAAADVANPAGTYSSVTTPDLTGGVFIRGAGSQSTQNVATRATWEAAAATDAEAAHTHDTAAHNHAISGVLDAAAGAAKFSSPAATDNTGPLTTGAGTSHAHALSDATAQLKVFDDTNGGLPLNIDLIWYMRR